MGINRVFKRGKPRIELCRRWPDGSTFRRYYPNKTSEKTVLARIEVSILDGSWPVLREGISEKSVSRGLTIEEFSERFLEESRSRVKPSTWERYRHYFRFINRDLGRILFKQIE